MKYENLSTTSGFLYLKAKSTTNAQHSAQINADSGIRAVSIGDDLKNHLFRSVLEFGIHNELLMAEA